LTWNENFRTTTWFRSGAEYAAVFQIGKRSAAGPFQSETSQAAAKRYLSEIQAIPLVGYGLHFLEA
jgi:hypothetical protein